MSCQKCQVLLHVEDKSGNLLVSCSVSELADKMIEYLEKKISLMSLRTVKLYGSAWTLF